MRRIQIAVSILALGAMLAARADASGIVYIGSDPSYHWALSHPQAATLAGNAARVVGGSSNPNIAFVGDTPDPGGNVAAMLNSVGLTNLTQFTPAQLATANLGSFQVVYIGANTQASGLVGAATNVQNFVNSGGGLVAEMEVFDAASWTWLPFASSIGHSGPTNVGGDLGTVVAPGHPVMAGITTAGLSNWGISNHSNFQTPGLAGFQTLATDLSGTPYIITNVVPEPAAFVLLGFGGVGMLWAAWRRLKPNG